MKNSWLITIFVVGVIITVFIAFNYQGGRDTVSLSEIFPNEGDYDVDIEYEFVDKDQKNVRQVDTVVETAQQARVIEETPQIVVKPKAVIKEAVAKPVVSNAKKPLLASQKKAIYAIQVSSHKSQLKASVVVKKLTAKGFDAYSKMRNLGDKGIWYRVYVGHFSTKQDAKNKLPSVANLYPNSFIIAPKK